MHIRIRADCHPRLAQLFPRDDCLKAATDVRRGDAVPNHIAEITGDVIVKAYLDTLIVNERQKGYARTQAGSHDAYAFIALTDEPVNCRTAIQNCLAVRLQRPP